MRYIFMCDSLMICLHDLSIYNYLNLLIFQLEKKGVYLKMAFHLIFTSNSSAFEDI